jgi:hypothetical protein
MISSSRLFKRKLIDFTDIRFVIDQLTIAAIGLKAASFINNLQQRLDSQSSLEKPRRRYGRYWSISWVPPCKPERCDPVSRPVRASSISGYWPLEVRSTSKPTSPQVKKSQMLACGEIGTN